MKFHALSILPTNVVAKVLTGLMRRIDRGMPAFFIDSTESLQKALQA